MIQKGSLFVEIGNSTMMLCCETRATVIVAIGLRIGNEQECKED